MYTGITTSIATHADLCLVSVGTSCTLAIADRLDNGCCADGRLERLQKSTFMMAIAIDLLTCGPRGATVQVYRREQSIHSPGLSVCLSFRPERP